MGLNGHPLDFNKTSLSNFSHLQGQALPNKHTLTEKNIDGQAWFNHVGQPCGWRKPAFCTMQPLSPCPGADKAPIPPGA